MIPSNLYKLSLTLIDTEEGHLLIENFVNTFFVTSLSVSLHNLLDLYIYYVYIMTFIFPKLLLFVSIFFFSKISINKDCTMVILI